MKINLCDGKYTIVYNEEKATVDEVLRHGEPWPAANPVNNLELAMVHAIVDHDALIREAREIISRLMELNGQAQAFLDKTKEST